MKQKILWLFAVAIMAVVSSCSRSGEILSTVPADSRGVAVVNVDSLLGGMGCSVADGKVELPQGVRLRNGLRTKLKLFASLGQAADMTRVVIAATAQNDMYATFRVHDRQATESALLAYGMAKSESKDGFEVYAGKGLCCYLDENQCWLTGEDDAISPKELLADARKGSVRSSFGAVAEFLDGNGLLSVAAPVSGIGVQSAADEWICVDARQSGKALLLHTKRMTSDGEVVRNRALRALNPSVLRLLPANTPLLAAVGLNGNLDWSGLVAAGGLAGGFQTMGMIESIVPFLEKTEGTVAFAAQPRDAGAWSDLGFSGWNFVFVAQMPEADALKAVEVLRTYLARMMFSIAPLSKGFSVNQNGLQLNVFARGDMLCVVNGNPQGGFSGGFSPESVGVVRLSVPEDMLIQRSALEVVADVSYTGVEVSLSLPQYDCPFLQALLSELSL